MEYPQTGERRSASLPFKDVKKRFLRYCRPEKVRTVLSEEEQPPFSPTVVRILKVSRLGRYTVLYTQKARCGGVAHPRRRTTRPTFGGFPDKFSLALYGLLAREREGRSTQQLSHRLVTEV